MVKRIIYEEGTRFEGTRLTYLRDVEKKSGSRVALFRCDCGNDIKVRIADAKSKTRRTKSCGCYLKESNVKNKTTHNLSNSREYKSYTAMKSRCSDVNFKDYKRYGARGITACERWKEDKTGFSNFLEDMGPRPDRYTLDRIDSLGNYTPSNCRWASAKVQAFNTQRDPRSTSLRVGVSKIERKGTTLYRAVIMNDGLHVKLIETEDFGEAVWVREQAEFEVYGFAKGVD